MKASMKSDMLTVRTDTVTAETITYRYTLEYSQSSHAAYRTPLYYIRVERLDPRGNCEQDARTDAIADPGYALILYEVLREHRVSPVHLREVAEDFER